MLGFLQRTLRSIVGILRTRFPQLKLVYVSSRIYGGYSESDLSPEPIAYESGFAVKWLIEERHQQSEFRQVDTLGFMGALPMGRWLERRAATALCWERSDFEPDGVHTSEQGALKVATMLLEFFQQDAAAKPWFFSPMM